MAAHAARVEAKIARSDGMMQGVASEVDLSAIKPSFDLGETSRKAGVLPAGKAAT